MASDAKISKPLHEATLVETRVEPTDFNLYYSTGVEGDLVNLLGAPHYSYRFAESKFTSAIGAQGIVAHKLAMPEYYNSAASLPESIHDTLKPDVHLIFRSTEQIRLLKCAWNICCFAWEFDVIKDVTEINEHPFLNQKRMLNLCDEIWVPCSYTKNILDKYGVPNTHIIPAPIQVSTANRPSILEALSDVGHIFVAPLRHNFLKDKAHNSGLCGEGSSILAEYISARLKNPTKTLIYLSILNPEDFRKNLDAMLRAFYYFSRDRDDVLLIVKVLTSKSRFALLDVLSDVIPRKLDNGTAIESNNIVFFNDFLTESAMSRLYSIADFYLCTSFCEGQNLPLLEAMAHGVVPITPAHTAMADYISSENAVVIATRQEPNDIVHLAATVARRPFSINRSHVTDVYDALQRSLGIQPSRYVEMSSNARRVVKDKYSPSVVWASIIARLAAIYPLVKRKQITGITNF